MDRFEFQIPDANLEKFKAMMTKVSRKSEKLGFAPIPFVVVGYHFDKERGKIWEMYLTSPSFKIAGWHFAATIDHTHETGNIIRCVPMEQGIPDRFRVSPPICEHCKIKRHRRDTYVLRSDSGEYKQVGKTCLVDFLGHDPAKLAVLAEHVGRMREDIEGFSFGGAPMIDLKDFLELSALSIRQYGWISRKSYNENPSGNIATADDALLRYYDRRKNHYKEITEADKALVQEALEWAQGLSEKADKSDYDHNVSIIAESSYIETRSAGIAASIIGVFNMNKNRKKTENAVNSNYIGKEGERLVNLKVKVLVAQMLDSGMVLCKFSDQEGNILSWFASNFDAAVGDTVFLTGTVRAHQEYKGVKNTNVTRCKIKMQEPA